MATLTTKGIKISVETAYHVGYSQPRAQKYFFAYRITIENQSEHTVQLISRYWKITNGNGSIREVEGAGVIGEQPVLAPGDVHQYDSGCPFVTDMGKMSGYYNMVNTDLKTAFKVYVPEFVMVAPFKDN